MNPRVVVDIYKEIMRGRSWVPGEHSTEFQRVEVLMKAVAMAAESDARWFLVLRKHSGSIADDCFVWHDGGSGRYSVYDFIRSCGSPWNEQWAADEGIDRFEPMLVGTGLLKNSEVTLVRPPRVS